MRGRRNTSDSGGWRFVAQCSYPVCLCYSQGALLGSFGAGAAVAALLGLVTGFALARPVTIRQRALAVASKSHPT